MGLAAALILFPLLLVINLIQILSTLAWPFSHKIFFQINRGLAFFWIGLCTTWAKKIAKINLVITGDEIPPQENAIVLSNHQEMPDIPVSWMLASQKGRTGDVKYLAKDSLKYIPGLGWGMFFIDCIFVKRDWARDRNTINQTFQRIIRHRTPLWLISYAEGTRFRPEKHQRSLAFAARQGLKPLKHLLIPRTKGFVAMVKGLRNHVQAIYDFAIAYPEGIPTLWQFMQGFCRKVHLHVRRFPIEELPDEDAEISRWLYRLYEEKDLLLEQFYRTGSFPTS